VDVPSSGQSNASPDRDSRPPVSAVQEPAQGPEAESEAVRDELRATQYALRMTRASLSWRVTGPLRLVGRAVRLFWRTICPPRDVVFELRPGAGIARSGERYTCESADPQLAIVPRKGRYPSGWTVVSYRIDQAKGALRPRLRVDLGYGYRERLSWPLPAVRFGEVCRAIDLPPGVVGLRFDPSDEACEFEFSGLRLRSGGNLWLASVVINRVFTRGPRPPSLRQAMGTIWRFLVPHHWQELKTKLMHRSGIFGDDPGNFQVWINLYDSIDEAHRAGLSAALARSREGPRFSLLMPVFRTPTSLLESAIESVRRQIYPNWELCIADDASGLPEIRQLLESHAARDSRIKLAWHEFNDGIAAASNSALAMASGDYLGLLDHDDELAEHALLAMAAEIEAHPGADVLYSDEDKLDPEGRRYDPYFKPDWNPDLFYAQNYLNHFTVYRRSLVESVGGFRPAFDGSQDYDLTLRVIERTTAAQIRHVPRILYHWRATEGSAALTSREKPAAVERARRALQQHLDRLGTGARVVPATASGIASVLAVYHRVCWPMPAERPLVSLIIPTRNLVEMLRHCIEGIRNQTAYEAWEMIVVDNGSDDPETLAYLASLNEDKRIRALRLDVPFNFSLLNNHAARLARGSILGFLNNDIAIAEPGWLEEMVSQALRPGIGAVGAKLLYGNGQVQHAGVILGIGGVAGHWHRFAERDDPGYFGRAQLTQNFSAVTAACMLVPKAVFDLVGGFDEENLPVAFNDVDLCLRIGEAGYRIVWTPDATLHHIESVSRGFEDTMEKRTRYRRECDYMRQKWGERLTSDPCYNPNLSIDQESPALAFPPRLDPLGDPAGHVVRQLSRRQTRRHAAMGSLKTGA